VQKPDVLADAPATETSAAADAALVQPRSTTPSRAPVDARLEEGDAPASTPAWLGSRRTWRVILLVWTVFGLVETIKGYIGLSLNGAPTGLAGWMRALVGNMPFWYGWALLTPVIFWIAARFRLDESRGRTRAIAVHALAAALASAVHLIVISALYQVTIIRTTPPEVLGREPSYLATLITWYNYFYVMQLFMYFGVAGAFYAFDYHRRNLESAALTGRLRAQAAQLQLGLAEARLHALRMELNPHFLFNTLNAIAGLARRQESDAVVAMLARLGDLLRATLDRDLGQETPLERELALLELYLDIERVRFGERLAVELRIAEETRQALVPTLVLQPLVENAIRHGIAMRPGVGRVRIAAWRDEGEIVLEVRDTGEGVAADRGVLPSGVGLSNTRSRLAQLYGDRARLSLENVADGGARTRVWLPYRPAPASGDIIYEEA
jgi:signal transduction histidine kinase